MEETDFYTFSANQGAEHHHARQMLTAQAAHLLCKPRDLYKRSVASFDFCLFTITWGICFSLER